MSKITRIRPQWISYNLGLALIASARSHDDQSQVGCVITNKNNRIISLGYNGFPKGMDDKSLPTTREDGKYPYMIHAEENAIYNLKNKLSNCIAYVTHVPCRRCLFALWQSGVVRAYCLDQEVSKPEPEEDAKAKEKFIKDTDFQLIKLKNVDFSWLTTIADKVRQ